MTMEYIKFMLYKILKRRNKEKKEDYLWSTLLLVMYQRQVFDLSLINPNINPLVLLYTYLSWPPQISQNRTPKP